jgi:hypothetical protein
MFPRNSLKLRGYARVALISALVLLYELAFQNCGRLKAYDYKTIDQSSQSVNPLPSPTPGPSPLPAPAPTQNQGLQILVDQPPAQTGMLGTQLQIPITIASSGGYAGMVNFRVDEPELKLLDPNSRITFIFSPASINLTAGASVGLILNVNIASNAPTFVGSVFHVVVSDSVNAAVVTTVDVSFGVKTATVAKFSQVYADILQPKCVACHGAGGAGGVSLNSYAGVAKVVKAGNAAQSALYISVSGAAPSMPLGGNPLSSADLQELASWINSGAPNN